MKSNRFWLEIIALGSAIALGIALLIATFGAAAVAVAALDANAQEAAPQPAAKTYEGMVSCARCKAKHPATLARAATNCVLTCVHNGAGFSLIDGDKVYQLTGDVSDLKKFAGQRARVTGVAEGDTIAVSSIASAG